MIERISHKLTRLALFAMTLVALGAHADDAETPMFSFSGFATLGVVHSDEDKADFRSSIFKPNGAGYSRRWSADVDSLIGAQVTAKLTPQLTAVVQVVSEQDHDNTYKPHVEWANIKYQFTPDFSVRIGRTVIPAFLVSGSRKVGYTYMWVRPPVEVYKLLPITNADGVDASYRMHFGEFTNTIQGNISRNDTKLTNAGYAKSRGSWAISDTVEYGPLTMHISYLKNNLTVESFNPLFNSFRQFGREGNAIADKYDPASKPSPFLGIGASYDPGNWFVMGEWSHVKYNSVLGESTAWYVSGGYRLKDLTLFSSYAKSKVDNLSDPGLTVSALPPFLAGPASGLNAALNSVLMRKSAQNTISIGGRWDFMKNADLKLQFDHTRIGVGSTGVLTNIQPGYRTGGKVNVFSATIDIVF